MADMKQNVSLPRNKKNLASNWTLVDAPLLLQPLSNELQEKYFFFFIYVLEVLNKFAKSCKNNIASTNVQFEIDFSCSGVGGTFCFVSAIINGYFR